MIERHMPDVNVVRVDRGGVGAKHRKCFIHGRDQISKDITLNCTVLLLLDYTDQGHLTKF